MIGTLWAGRAEERRKEYPHPASAAAVAVARIARRVRFAYRTGVSYLFVFGPGQGGPDIGVGIIDLVQVT